MSTAVWLKPTDKDLHNLVLDLSCQPTLTLVKDIQKWSWKHVHTLWQSKRSDLLQVYTLNTEFINITEDRIIHQVAGL